MATSRFTWPKNQPQKATLSPGLGDAIFLIASPSPGDRTEASPDDYHDDYPDAVSSAPEAAGGEVIESRIDVQTPL